MENEIFENKFIKDLDESFQDEQFITEEIGLELANRYDDLQIVNCKEESRIGIGISIFSSIGCLACACALTKEPTYLNVIGFALLGFNSIYSINSVNKTNIRLEQTKKRKMIRNMIRSLDEKQ